MITERSILRKTNRAEVPRMNGKEANEGRMKYSQGRWKTGHAQRPWEQKGVWLI